LPLELKHLKGIVKPFEHGNETRLIRSAVKKILEARQLGNLIFFFLMIQSHSGLRISEMTLSNQSHFPRFLDLEQAGIARPLNMTLGSWFHQALFQI
jgi:hypothetical protein